MEQISEEMMRDEVFSYRLKCIAIAVFNDNRMNDPQYPFMSWEGQAQEIINSCAPEFIDQLFESDPEYYGSLGMCRVTR